MLTDAVNNMILNALAIVTLATAVYQGVAGYELYGNSTITISNGDGTLLAVANVTVHVTGYNRTRDAKMLNDFVQSQIAKLQKYPELFAEGDRFGGSRPPPPPPPARPGRGPFELPPFRIAKTPDMFAEGGWSGPPPPPPPPAPESIQPSFGLTVSADWNTSSDSKSEVKADLSVKVYTAKRGDHEALFALRAPYF